MGSSLTFYLQKIQFCSRKTEGKPAWEQHFRKRFHIYIHWVFFQKQEQKPHYQKLILPFIKHSLV